MCHFNKLTKNMGAIKEFLEGAVGYLETLERCENKTCFVCGMKAESIKKLKKEIEELQEKAWKYDDLCK